MAGRGRGQGQNRGRGGGSSRGDGMGDAGGRADPGRQEQGGTPESLIRHGRSADSPGHQKKAAGAKSARDFAPGRAGRAGSPGLLDIAPDELPAEE